MKPSVRFNIYIHFFRSIVDAVSCPGLLIIAAVLLMSGCRKHKEARHEPIRPVLSMVAAPHSGPADGFSGTVEPRYKTDLGFRLLGRIVARDVNVGDPIKEGQRLAKLDPTVVENALRSAEASLTNAKSQRQNSASSLKRQEILLSRKVSSPAEYDLSKKADEVAIATVAQAQADLDKAKEELAYTELKSDLNGVVTDIYVEIGETVTPGQIVCSIANPDLREAVVDIAEDAISALTMESEFRVTISPSIECIGTVREIAPQADAKTRTRRVRISLHSPAEAFRLGTTIKAFPKNSLRSNIRLPLNAIFDRDGSSFVWIVDPNLKKVKSVSVKLTNRNNLSAEISEGVSIGDRIVTSGVHSLTDGQSIRWRTGDDR